MITYTAEQIPTALHKHVASSLSFAGKRATRLTVQPNKTRDAKSNVATEPAINRLQPTVVLQQPNRTVIGLPPPPAVMLPVRTLPAL